MRWKIGVLAAIVAVTVLTWVWIHRPLPKYVIGKGVWIYQMPACEGGNVIKMAKRAKSNRLDYVAVRTNGKYGWDKTNSPQMVKNLINQLHKNKIKVYGWGYIYGDHPQRDFELIKKFLVMGGDGYVFNVEDDHRDKYTNARKLCELTRVYVDKNCPEKFLAYSTHCRVKAQPGIPREIYDQYCDAAMPQLYWNMFRNRKWTAKQAAYRMMDEWLEEQKKWAHPAKPIIPTLESSNRSKYVRDMPYTPPDELRVVSRSVSGYFGINYYSWDIAGEKHWRVIRKAPGDLAWQRRHNAHKAKTKTADLKVSSSLNWSWLWSSVLVIWIGGAIILIRETKLRCRKIRGWSHLMFLVLWPVMYIFYLAIELVTKRK